MRKTKLGGSWPAVWYTWRKAREAGGVLKLWRAMRTKNACKTCALGMGGQRGGMVNEIGHFPEVCKKSLQAMVADMQGAIRGDFWQRYTPPELQQLSPRELEACGRLVEPVLYHSRDTGRYTPISWDDALARITRKLLATSPDETFWYFSGRSSNEAGFLLQLFARLYGTNNVNNCSYYCHQASGVGLSSVTGSGTATIELEDLDQADLIFVIGGNPASNHPRLMRTLMGVRRRGGSVIVVNPIVETGLVRFGVPSDWRSLLFGSSIASQYVQPHIGGDLAMLTGVAKRIVEMNAQDERFLLDHCLGWAELRARLASVTWDEIVCKEWRLAAGNRFDRRALRRSDECRFQLDDGHHTPRPRRAKRSGDRQSRPVTRVWSVAVAAGCCRFAATRTCRASARWALRPRSRTQSSIDCRIILAFRSRRCPAATR